ncbi:MAG: cation transporter [Clostridiales bacterium]|nr:cation transporter [Clostridiales bacterium]
MGENNLSCIELNIDRMTCANCQNRIQTALIKLDGIVKAEVSFSLGTASVVFDKTVITTEKIIDCVNALGYNAVVGTRNKNISRAIVFFFNYSYNLCCASTFRFA